MASCRAAARQMGCAIAQELPLVHAISIETPSAELAKAGGTNVERVDADSKVRWLRGLPDFTAEAIDIGARSRSIKENALIAGPPAMIPWGVERVGAPLLWSRTRGEGATVAVLDTGIDASHPDLRGQVLGGVNILDPRHPDDWKDDEGHGTHVSGTIAGRGLDGGLAGVAPRAKLYAVKVLDKDGAGNYSDVIAGIQWAMDHGIKIANMSLAVDEDSEPLHRAVQAALAKGMLIIAAAGNTGGPVSYPGAYPEAIAVGASDFSGRIAPFSARGPEVAYVAPGVDILSTRAGGGYTALSGTSTAAPHVSGLAALAYAAGATTPAALRAALDEMALPLPGLALRR